MSVVYEAIDPTLGRRIALKLLQRELSARHAKRLLREAQALAKLSHSNVVQVYEVGEHEGQSYIAMELVEGQTLNSWMQQEPRPDWRKCIDVYLQAGEGLSVAHQRGLIHRDFKPSNAVIDEQGKVKVLDFGLVREASEEDQGNDPDDSFHSAERITPPQDPALEALLTRPGSIMGTPAYMSPEQRVGDPADARSDQYSFCVALHEAIYTEHPLAITPLGATTHAALRPAPTRSDVPQRVLATLRRGLRQEPQERWPSMDALLAELRDIVAPKTRARWVPLAMAATVGLAGVGLASVVGEPTPCTGATEHLQGIWNDESRAAIEGTFLATALPFAPETWERVQRRLDDYTSRWAEKHTEICEATNIHKEQSTGVMDRRMACLHTARSGLATSVDVLTAADESQVKGAVSLLADLPPIESCDRIDALQATLVPPAEIAEEVQRLRTQLEQARVLTSAGIVERALALSGEVLTRAQAIDFQPLVAEAYLRRGSAQLYDGSYADSERDLEQAYALATEVGHRTVEVAAAAELVELVGSRQARHDNGLWWGKVALALSKNREVDERVQGEVESAIGTVFLRKGDFNEALTHGQRANRLLTATLDPSDPSLARALNNIGNALISLNRIDDALDHYQRSFALQSKALGPRHPEVSNPLLNIGTVLRRQNKFDEAQEHYLRAIEIREQGLGPDHPEVAMALDNSGNVWRDQGNATQALATYERSLAIKEKALGQQHPAVGLTLNNIALTLADLGRPREALQYHRRALAVREQTLAPNHIDIANSLSNMSYLLAREGEPEEAIAAQLRALKIYTEVYGPTHPQLGSVLGQTGQIYHRLGDLESATSYYREALEVFELPSSSLEHYHHSITKKNMGWALSELGKPDEALTHFREALALRRETLGPDHPLVADSLQDVGEALGKAGDFAGANENLGRALKLRQSALPSNHPLIATTHIKLAEVALQQQDFKEAQRRATQAVTVLEDSDADASEGAHARFMLARSLWPDRAQRARAVALAAAAAAVLRETPGADLVEVEQWLATHSPPSP